MAKGIGSPLALGGLFPSMDDRYVAANGMPFTSVSNAESALNGFPSKLSGTCIGLTVLVKESGWTEAKEYWVQPKGTMPETYGLVEKGGEDLTKALSLSGEQKHNAAANINNRAADVESGAVKALGYKVLNPDVALASQIGEANTVYEIRDAFDLSNDSVTMPSGCTLKFTGGRVSNGTITGDVRVAADDFSVIGSECFHNGFNMSEDVLYSDRIGMIANDANYAVHNNHLLELVCAMTSKKIVLTNLYYIAGKRNVIGTIVIEGGCLQFTSSAPTKSYFDMKEHSSLTLNGVKVVGTGDNGKRLISTANTLDYQIDGIIINNCDFTACNVVNMDKVANKKFTTSSPFGIKRFVVKNNKFDDIRWNTILLNDCVVSTEMTVEGNFVNGFIGQFIGIGQTNSYSYNTNNKKYQAEFIVRNNTFVGRPYATTGSGEYFCPCLFEGNRVIMDGNIIKNVIAVGTNYAYDSYVSSNEYYFTNNTVINVTNFRLVKSNSPTSEIFKSKGRGTVRVATGNKWYIDWDEVEQIVTSYGFTIPAGFSVVKEQMIFNFTRENKYVNFSDNTIELKGGVLNMSPSGNPVIEAVINRNIFKVDETEGSLMPYWGGLKDENNNFHSILQKLEFCYNTIEVANTAGSFYICCGYMPDNISQIAEVRIENNVSNVPIGAPSGCKKVILRNNNIKNFIVSSSVKLYNPVDKIGSYIEIPYVATTPTNIAFNSLNKTLRNVVLVIPQLEVSENNYYATFHVSTSQKIAIEIPSLGIKSVLAFETDENNIYLKDEAGKLIKTYSKSETSSTEYAYRPSDNNAQRIIFNVYGTQEIVRFVAYIPAGYSLPKTVVSYVGATDFSPKNDLLSKGIESFDGKPNYWNGIKWVDADGFTNNDRIGTINNRPLSPQFGFCFIDTNIGKPIFWTGNEWIDASGEFAADNSGNLTNRLALTPKKGQQFQQTVEGSTVNLVYGDYGWLKASDRTPWFDDNGTLDVMYDKYSYGYTLLTKKPSNWETNFDTYYKLVDGVYTLLTTSEKWASNTYYKKDVNVYKGIQVKLTDADTELLDKVVKWNGAKFINVIDNIALKAGTPTIVFNTENDVTTATITSTSSGKIYYTKDGTDPTSSSIKYNTQITLSNNDQIKAICIRDYVDNSDICFVKIATPAITFDDITGKLTISCDTANVKIYYTIDGSTPTTSSTEYNPSTEVSIVKGTTVKAIAALIGRVNSDVKTEKRS